nr:MAG TPA: hypothetical protein [Caudoviricetes sp.]DAS26222.1 MAG TPA: hypothetical protein [Caudoviricetes sp.]
MQVSPSQCEGLFIICVTLKKFRHAKIIALLFVSFYLSYYFCNTNNTLPYFLCRIKVNNYGYRRIDAYIIVVITIKVYEYKSL